jgi:hypothetical protein
MKSDMKNKGLPTSLKARKEIDYLETKWNRFCKKIENEEISPFFANKWRAGLSYDLIQWELNYLDYDNFDLKQRRNGIRDELERTISQGQIKYKNGESKRDEKKDEIKVARLNAITASLNIVLETIKASHNGRN